MISRWTIVAAFLAIIVSGNNKCMAQVTWSIAGRNVLTLHAAHGDMTPQKRVEELDDRVVEILSRHEGVLGSADIVLKREKGEIFIVVGLRVLVTVMAGDAEGYHTTREKLAKVWLGNIRTSLPQLAPRVNKGGS